jgi:hypothetical protein
MQRLYQFLGRRLFPRRQTWQQRLQAKIVVHTVVFSVALGLALAEVMRLMYYHRK